MNKIFAILIMCSLSLPVLAIEEQEVDMPPSNQEILEVVEPENISNIDNNTNEQDLTTKPNQALSSTYKEPIGKKKLAKKFIIAMLCVVGTSAFLYVSLSIYNKIREGVISNSQPLEEGEQTLSSSSDITEAVKTFVEKTHWN